MSDDLVGASSDLPSADAAAVPELITAEIVMPRPWGGWATLGWLILGCGIWVVVGTVVSLPIFFSRLDSFQPEEMTRVAEELEFDSLLLSLGTLLTAVVVAGYVALLAWCRGWSPAEYLALDRPSLRTLGWSLAAALAFVVVQDGLTYLSGRDIVPEFMFKVMDSGYFPLLVIALTVGAPIGEELLFRGFAFRGFLPALGPTATVLVTSIIFGALHIQYDLIGIFVVILTGVLLGAIRYYAKSTTTTIVIHGVINGLATLEALFLAP